MRQDNKRNHHNRNHASSSLFDAMDQTVVVLITRGNIVSVRTHMHEVTFIAVNGVEHVAEPTFNTPQLTLCLVQVAEQTSIRILGGSILSP